jgi:hypothetical protein
MNGNHTHNGDVFDSSGTSEHPPRHGPGDGPSPPRFVEVLTGQSKWTAEERQQIDRDPKLRQYELDMLAALYAPLAELVSPEPVVEPVDPEPWTDEECLDFEIPQAAGPEARPAPVIEPADGAEDIKRTVAPEWREPANRPKTVTVLLRVDHESAGITVLGLESFSTIRYQAAAVEPDAEVSPDPRSWRQSSEEVPVARWDSVDLARQLLVFLAERQGEVTVNVLRNPIRITL